MDNIKVSYKILIMVIIAAVGMAIVGIRGTYSIQNANSEMVRLYEEDMRSIELLGQACEKMRTIQVRSMQATKQTYVNTDLKAVQQLDISCTLAIYTCGDKNHEEVTTDENEP